MTTIDMTTDSAAYRAGLKDGLAWDLDGYETSADLRPTGWSDSTIAALGATACRRAWGVEDGDEEGWALAFRQYDRGAWDGVTADKGRTGRPPRDAGPKKIEKLKITMSERRPLTIVKADWPLIARASRHDGAVECQANHEWAIKVREHDDGRRLVYGWLRAGNGGVPAGWRGREGGFLVAAAGRDNEGRAIGPDDEETVRAIRRVGGIIDDDGLAAECIADMPGEEI